MALVVSIRVVPNAKQVKCILDTQQVLKCYVTAVPEDGKANRQLIAILAQALQIPRSMIEIVQGQTSRLKRVHIDAPVTYEALLIALGIEVPQSLFRGG